MKDYIMKNKRIISFILTAVMMLSLLSAMYISGNAANEVLTLKQGSTLKLYSKNGYKYVSGMPFGTKAAALSANFKGSVKITDDSGTELKDTDVLANGYKVTLTSSGDTAYVIVQGDTDNNGKITISDFLRIKRNFMGVFTLTGVSLEAADVIGDGIISSNDYLAIKAHFKNGIMINSSFTNANLKDDTPEPSGYDLPFIPS